jgi:hypothetical protein
MDPTADLFVDDPQDSVASLPAVGESDPLYLDGGRYDQGVLTSDMKDAVFSTFGSGSKEAFLTTKPISLNEFHKLSTRRK